MRNLFFFTEPVIPMAPALHCKLAVAASRFCEPRRSKISGWMSITVGGEGAQLGVGMSY